MRSSQTHGVLAEQHGKADESIAASLATQPKLHELGAADMHHSPAAADKRHPSTADTHYPRETISGRSSPELTPPSHSQPPRPAPVQASPSSQAHGVLAEHHGKADASVATATPAMQPKLLGAADKQHSLAAADKRHPPTVGAAYSPETQHPPVIGTSYPETAGRTGPELSPPSHSLPPRPKPVQAVPSPSARLALSSPKPTSTLTDTEILLVGVLGIVGVAMLALYYARRPTRTSYSAIRKADTMELEDDEEEPVDGRRLSLDGPGVYNAAAIVTDNADEQWQTSPPRDIPLLLVDDADDDAVLDRARALLSSFAEETAHDTEASHYAAKQDYSF